MCVAQLKRRKPGGIWYANDNIAEKKSCRNMVCVWSCWRREKLEKYGMCMATLGREKTGGTSYVYGTVREGTSWRNMVCVWQRWGEKNLEEYGMCMVTLEKEKAGGIWYMKAGQIWHMYNNVGKGKSWKNVVCVWQRWREEKPEEYGMCKAILGRGKPGGIRYMYGNVGEGKN